MEVFSCKKENLFKIFLPVRFKSDKSQPWPSISNFFLEFKNSL